MIQKNEKPVVLVVEKIFQKGKTVFDSIPDMAIVAAPDEEDALSAMIKEKNAFAVVLGVEKYSGPLYEALKKGGIIARFGVGCDGVDFEKAKHKYLFVTNTPGVLESTVAEFTIFLAAEVLRKPGMINEEMKKGKWNPVTGRELNGKVWAIIGLGKIGRRLGQMLSLGFGVKVIACKKNIIEPDKIMKEADIVSLHLPANKGTYHFLNRDRISWLKPGVILINTGRGSLIDENALYDALKNGQLSGAGLDVFENEPYKPLNPDKDLRELPNVVLTPHIASNTMECSRRMAERVIQNIRFAIEEKYELMDIVSA